MDQAALLPTELQHGLKSFGNNKNCVRGYDLLWI